MPAQLMPFVADEPQPVIRPLSPSTHEADHLVEEWLRCRTMLIPAIEREGTHTERDVFDRIVDGHAQLWSASASACVTELVEYPRRKVCRVWLGGGDLDEMVEVLCPAVQAWAREHGCSRAEVNGRRWCRLLGGQESYITRIEL